MTRPDKLIEALRWCQRAIDERDPEMANFFIESAACAIRAAQDGDTVDEGLFDRDNGEMG